MKFIKIFLSLLIFSFITSCDIINPEEDIPAYIEIKEFNYTPEPGGSSSTKITDGWIYVDGEFLGAFNLPRTIPVLRSGEVNIILDAGIKENGIVETPGIYPFYERYATTVTLTPGETVTIQPDTKYDESVAKNVFDENFDDSNLNFSEFEKTDIGAKEGDSGILRLDDEDKPSLSGLSGPILEFPGQGDVAFLELDYKGDVNIFVGVTGYDSFGQDVFTELRYGLNPKEDWNKVYFNFTELMDLLKEQTVDSYRIRIAAQIPLVDGVFIYEEAEVMIDNVKLFVF